MISSIINSYTYSFAEFDKGVKICELQYQNILKELIIIKSTKKNKGIICIDYTISLEYIYIQDDEGTIYFIDIYTDPLNPYIIKFFPQII